MTTLAGKMVLERSPLFRGLDRLRWSASSRLRRSASSASGEDRIQPGRPGDALFRGRSRAGCASAAGTADGGEISFNIMEPGIRSAKSPCSTAVRAPQRDGDRGDRPRSIRRDHLFSLLEREPKVALELLKLCGSRLRWTSGLVEDAALLDAPARLAKRLLSLAELHGQRTKVGITLRISQEDLATFLSLSGRS
jgi:hypothetical protein